MEHAAIARPKEDPNTAYMPVVKAITIASIPKPVKGSTT
ncbi:hypothetical protein CCACVL1_29164 [Corchorus capsularis]|uniref:Uncharacterized protein n=1 Tax=Corchorus capsularis TaxID=210143 RepID=A0A1R3G3F6_COCAP|nr:hypothetical protein CCACVL1_29164 [Corchorus capsularis]